MNRRNFLKTLGATFLGLAGCKLWPDEGIWNPCLLPLSMPEKLLDHDLVQAAWDGVEPEKTWDCHVHLIGVGHGETGIWINPDMFSFLHPTQFAQRKFFLNASCADVKDKVDQVYLKRLMKLQDAFPKGFRLMLLSFDYHYSESGQSLASSSSFYTPDKYGENLARQFPDRFEWIASIHPYRKDCVEALEKAAQNGARAVKWLPPAMGINPASPLCDQYYEALVRLNIPLLTHGGKERAVHGSNAQEFGNPLLLRRALDHGARTIVAHCASMGTSVDIDKGENGPQVDNFTLFARLMNEQRYEKLLFGDISAMTQANRVGAPLDAVISRTEWHSRLLNGSDYPLPGVMPLFSMKLLVEKNYITSKEAAIVSDIRKYNPLLFDFVLKRNLKVGKKRISTQVFETRSVFDKTET